MRRAVAAACALRVCHRLRVVRLDLGIPLDSTRSEMALERRPNAGDFVQGIGRGRDGFLQRILTAAARGAPAALSPGARSQA